MSEEHYKGSSIAPEPTRRVDGRFVANGVLRQPDGATVRNLRFTAPGEFDSAEDAAAAFVSEAKRRLDAGEI